MGPKTPPGGDDRGFQRVLEFEIAAINERRSATKRTDLCFNAQRKTMDTVGLALSGGGIRSAAFSLGVLQALDRFGILRRVDYLSTVSGGGYIGASLTATMTKSHGSFVFRDSPTDTGTPSFLETGKSAAVRHVRNYSNYLLPPGGRYFGELTMTILRGVIPNFGLLLSILLVFAALTILSNSLRSSLACTSVLGLSLCDKGFKVFGITSILGALGIIVDVDNRAFTFPPSLAWARITLSKRVCDFGSRPYSSSKRSLFSSKACSGRTSTPGSM